MKQMSLPQITIAVPKQNEGFVLKLNEAELNVILLIGSVNLDIGMNTVEKYLSKVLVKIVEDQKYLDFVKNEENVKTLEQLKPEGQFKNLGKKFGVRDSDALLYVKTDTLFFNEKKFLQTVTNYGDSELRKAFRLPYIYEERIFMIKDSNYMYQLDKLNSFIYFNYLNGEVYYSLTAKSLLSGLITDNLSLRDISVVF